MVLLPMPAAPKLQMAKRWTARAIIFHAPMTVTLISAQAVSRLRGGLKAVVRPEMRFNTWLPIMDPRDGNYGKMGREISALGLIMTAPGPRTPLLVRAAPITPTMPGGTLWRLKQPPRGWKFLSTEVQWLPPPPSREAPAQAHSLQRNIAMT